MDHAVILAAGRGSRLRPLTDHVPKPMLPIDGTAVILTVLGQLEANGISSVTIVTGYLEDLLRQFVSEQYRGTMQLSFATQAQQLGSGHALQCALEAGMPPSDAVVMASDTVWQDSDVAALLAHARDDAEAIVTMAVQRWPIAKLPHNMQTVLDQDSRVANVVSPYPADADLDGDGVPHFALCGSPLYAFAKGIWQDIASATPSSNGLTELALTLQQVVDRGQIVRGFEVTASRDITRPDDLLRHNFPYLRDLGRPLGAC